MTTPPRPPAPPRFPRPMGAPGPTTPGATTSGAPASNAPTSNALTPNAPASGRAASGATRPRFAQERDAMLAQQRDAALARAPHPPATAAFPTDAEPNAPAESRPFPRRGPEPDRICGLAAVTALFTHRPDAVLRLFYLATRRAEAGRFCQFMAREKKPYREVPAEELARIGGTTHHGGIVAIATPRFIPALPEAGVLPPMLLPVLDGIGNPHNLGAIARSAAFFGCGAMVLSADVQQASVSDAAWRTSEGGLEALSLYRATNMAASLAALAPRFLTVAAVAHGGETPEAIAADPRPIALVLGNEEHGLATATAAACARRVTLPGSGMVESLNVSVAAAVLMYALGRR